MESANEVGVKAAAAIPRKKEALKPRVDEADVVVISSDEGESCRSGRKARDRSSKKPNKAFTSILSARSKVQILDCSLEFKNCVVKSGD